MDIFVDIVRAGYLVLAFVGGLALGIVGMVTLGIALSVQTTRHP